jgi:biopolymer transport protein TolQ
MNQDEVISQVISTTSSQDLSIWGLISSADAVGKLVMFILVLLSIWSWAIILDKIFKFNLIKKKITQFDEVFWAGQALDQLHDRLKRSIDNPLAAIFVSAMNELKRTSTTKQITDSVLKIGQKDRIMQAMSLVKNRESERIESYLGFLAGVGAYSPFIGLFGTVWGIMHSFQSIAASKNTSLAVVAPGIAEALLATAIGLLAAIPAVAFYNYLVSQSNYIQNRMDDFIAELYTILSRSIDEEKI